MSHVVQIDVALRDLDAIKAAAARLGMVFREGQTQYRWWGHSVSDYPLPVGMREDELGACLHAITLPDGHPRRSDAYEIGVAARKDGDGYALVYDFFGPGMCIRDIVGEDLGLFKQAYAVELAKHELQLEGWMVNEVLAADGSIELVATQ